LSILELGLCVTRATSEPSRLFKTALEESKSWSQKVGQP
jgi:hypothetical protein